MIKVIGFICLCVLVVSCDKKSEQPEDVLSNYVTQFLSKSLSKNDAISHLGKNLKTSIEEMDEAEYSSYLEKNSFEKRSFRILLKNCNELKCQMTYVVKYRQKTLATKEYNVDVKKIAQLEKIEEEWKITDIENVKTFIDAKNPIDIHQ